MLVQVPLIMSVHFLTVYVNIIEELGVFFSKNMDMVSPFLVYYKIKR